LLYALLFHFVPSLPAQGLLQYLGTADSVVLPVPQGGEGIGLPGTAFRYLGVVLDKPSEPNFVVAAPSRAVSPAISWIGMNSNVVPYLPPGGYGLTVNFGIAGQTSPYASVQVTLTLLPPPPPLISSIVNAASLQPGISPGEVVTIFGANIGTPPVFSQYNDAGLYPTSLGNTTVTFNGTEAALLYVSKSQINAAVPFEVAGQRSVDVVVTHDFVSTQAFSVPINDTSPAIFTATQTGKGQF